VQKYWSVVFAVVVVLCAGMTILAPAVGGWWLPLMVSSFGGEIDFLFNLILWIVTFFFFLTEALMVYAMWKYAHVEGRKAAYIHGNHSLEFWWTVVPAVILVLIGVLQIGTWENIKYQTRMPKPDGKTQQMDVAARQWEWRIRYPSPEAYARWADPANEQAKTEAERWGEAPHYDDIHLVNEVHVWAHDKKADPNDKDPQKVLIHLHTRDVIHSFFLPNMRLKQDALPGKVIPVWFQAEDYNTARNEAGVWQDGYDPKKGQWAEYNEKTDEWTHLDRIWDLACAEFCGSRHSMMKGKLYVHKNRADFLEWLQSAAKAQNVRK
jgi:cytochrome c oxidase subunit 2